MSAFPSPRREPTILEGNKSSKVVALTSKAYHRTLFGIRFDKGRIKEETLREFTRIRSKFDEVLCGAVHFSNKLRRTESRNAGSTGTASCFCRYLATPFTSIVPHLPQCRSEQIPKVRRLCQGILFSSRLRTGDHVFTNYSKSLYARLSIIPGHVWNRTKGAKKLLTILLFPFGSRDTPLDIHR